MSDPEPPSWIDDLEHLEGLDEAAVVADRSGRVVFANTTAHLHYPLRRDDATPLQLAAGLLPAGEADQFAEIAGEALAGRHWSGRLEVRRSDGTRRVADVTCSPLRHAGALVGMVCLVDDAVGERG